ncbi:MAG: cobalamin biosynthesis protein CobQ [Ruminiclostridium sp.]|nr:cobalamin biosynthesis protein CobQ [Ruminiclostridium sp.]
MKLKKLTVITGHYGSGKTNVSVNLALEASKAGQKCTVIDLDIVNPYFRTADFEELFRENGITLKTPQYANSNLDIPALGISVKGILDESDCVIIDVGGDDEGAKALGRYAKIISECDDKEMLYVINKCRYLTKEPEEALALMREIETAGSIECTGIINNTNLGNETDKSIIENSLGYAREVASAAGLPIRFTTGKAEFLTNVTDNPLPIEIYVKTLWN